MNCEEGTKMKDDNDQHSCLYCGLYQLNSLYAETLTTICLVITLCLLIICSAFVSEEQLIVIAVAVILVITSTPAAIFFKSPFMLLPLISITALLIAACISLLTTFNIQQGDILELTRIRTFDDGVIELIQFPLDTKSVKVTLYFALLYLTLQMFAVYVCIRHYKIVRRLKMVNEQEESNIDWISYISDHCTETNQKLPSTEVPVNNRLIIPSAPPNTCHVHPFRPQPHLFPPPYGENRRCGQTV
ncbi:hypothetical protein Tcan_09151 [Toxocara canis]|uniref:Transmembrane protein n=1 Tax=Toxocara canis TaxID=6265 RepID=A0A0B2V0D3_TOXCA|nr:hypothetical protein Tcan_09151 [Toxocara canis]